MNYIKKFLIFFIFNNIDIIVAYIFLEMHFTCEKKIIFELKQIDVDMFIKIKFQLYYRNKSLFIL